MSDAPVSLVVISAATPLPEAVNLTLVASVFDPGLGVLLLEPAASECSAALWRRLAEHGIATVYVPAASRAAMQPPSAPSVAALSDERIAAWLSGAERILSL